MQASLSTGRIAGGRIFCCRNHAASDAQRQAAPVSSGKPRRAVTKPWFFR
jgi:hypothetical protein